MEAALLAQLWRELGLENGTFHFYCYIMCLIRNVDMTSKRLELIDQRETGVSCLQMIPSLASARFLVFKRRFLLLII